MLPFDVLLLFPELANKSSSVARFLLILGLSSAFLFGPRCVTLDDDEGGGISIDFFSVAVVALISADSTSSTGDSIGNSRTVREIRSPLC